ncbi:hypothetical protein D3C81_1951200 [compost metagenome]
MGMPLGQRRQLSGQELNSIAFSRPNPHQAGYPAGNALPLLLLDGQESAFHGLHLCQQAPASFRQRIPRATADE